MTQTRRIPWATVAAGLLVLGATTLIVRSAIQGPRAAGIPSQATIDAARNRVLVPAGGSDLQATRSQGNWVAGLGIVEPADRETKVAANATGRIAAILVHEGQTVAKGDALARLDDETEQAALLAAEGDVSVAQAEYRRLVIGSRKEDIDAAVAEASAQRIRTDQIRRALERTEALAVSGALSAAQLDDARHELDSAKATLAVVDARKRAVLAGTRQDDLVVSQAHVQAARSRADQARLVLAQRTVRSPVVGTILQIKARAGEYYSPQNPNQEAILLMGDLQKLRVRVDVDERDIGAVSVGAAAHVTADAYPGRTFAGKVVEVGQRLGRKNIRTDDPIERIDTKILETVIELDQTKVLKPGLRVWAFIAPH